MCGKFLWGVVVFLVVDQVPTLTISIRVKSVNLERSLAIRSGLGCWGNMQRLLATCARVAGIRFKVSQKNVVTFDM